MAWQQPRARARIFYRRKDHAAALSLLRDLVSTTALDEPIERCLMLREAAISAAELGQWGEARQWFDSAREAAERAVSPSMKPTAIGLQADTAVAAYHSGDPTGALIAMAKAIEALGSIDPDSSVKAAYCHRVIRHACLWLFRKATRQEDLDGAEATVVLPGICSNPEPPDLRDMPLASLEYVWYMLAQTEIVEGVDAGIEGRLREALNGRTIPSMEIMLRRDRIQRDIRRFDAATFIEDLPAWREAHLNFLAHPELLRDSDPTHPHFGELETVTPQQAHSPEALRAIEDALLVFGIYAALSRQPQALASLVARIEPVSVNDPRRPIVSIMATGEGGRDRLEDYIAGEIYKVAHRSDLDPNELFVAGVRFVQAAARSDFKHLLVPILHNWAQARWDHVLREQRFFLRNPAATVAPIETALARPDTGLGFTAKLLVAAQPAVQTRIDQTFREFLLSL